MGDYNDMNIDDNFTSEQPAQTSNRAAEASDRAAETSVYATQTSDRAVEASDRTVQTSDYTAQTSAGRKDTGSAANVAAPTEAAAQNSDSAAAASQNTSGQTYGSYRFSESNYANQAEVPKQTPPTWNSSSFQKKAPKQPHDTLRELGLFAAKAAIASVIGSVIFVGTFAIAEHTGLISFGTKAAATDSSGFSGYGQMPDFDEFFGGQGGDTSPGDSSQDGTDEQNTDGPRLGVTVESVEADQLQEGSPAGALIQSVESGSDAEAAGLMEGDIITAFGGTNVTSASTLASLVHNSEAGDTVTITYKRAENESYTTYTAQVTFSETEDAE